MEVLKIITVSELHEQAPQPGRLTFDRITRTIFTLEGDMEGKFAIMLNRKEGPPVIGRFNNPKELSEAITKLGGADTLWSLDLIQDPGQHEYEQLPNRLEAILYQD